MEDDELAPVERREVEPLGDPRREADDLLDARVPRRPIATAPPIEKPIRSVCGAPSRSTAASASSAHMSSRFHDLIRY